MQKIPEKFVKKFGNERGAFAILVVPNGLASGVGNRWKKILVS